MTEPEKSISAELFDAVTRQIECLIAFQKLGARVDALERLQSRTEIAQVDLIGAQNDCVRLETQLEELQERYDQLLEYNQKGRKQDCGCDGALDYGCENCWSPDELRARYREAQVLVDRIKSAAIHTEEDGETCTDDCLGCADPLASLLRAKTALLHRINDLETQKGAPVP